MPSIIKRTLYFACKDCMNLYPHMREDEMAHPICYRELERFHGMPEGAALQHIPTAVAQKAFTWIEVFHAVQPQLTGSTPQLEHLELLALDTGEHVRETVVSTIIDSGHTDDYDRIVLSNCDAIIAQLTDALGTIVALSKEDIHQVVEEAILNSPLTYIDDDVDSINHFEILRGNLEEMADEISETIRGLSKKN